MPTLGRVAEERRFALLHELLLPVVDTPVDQLSPGVRGLLQKRGGRDLELLVETFFSACDAAVRSAEQRKRAREGGDGDEDE